MQKVMVTGANGFLGTAVCRELVHSGKKVIAVVHSASSDVSQISAMENINILSCDMNEYSKLHELDILSDVDTVYHFAWNGTSGNKRSDYEIQLNNIMHTCDLLEVCKKIGCKRFIYASSIMEYEIQALERKTQLLPGNSIYSSAKMSANYLLKALCQKNEIEYLRCIISNVYGPGEKSERMINTSIRKMLHGEHCGFSEGEQMYDFIYIDDAAKSFVAVGEKGKSNSTYYIGSNKPRKLKEFLKEMEEQVKPKESIVLGEVPFNGVMLDYYELFDLEAVKRDTGFSPMICFALGIEKTKQWILEEDDKWDLEKLKSCHCRL